MPYRHLSAAELPEGIANAQVWEDDPEEAPAEEAPAEEASAEVPAAEPAPDGGNG